MSCCHFATQLPNIGWDEAGHHEREEAEKHSKQGLLGIARYENGPPFPNFARANGTKLGQRRVEPAVEAQILELRARGDGILKIGRQLGVGTSVVQRVFKQEPQLS
jgi:hypothetical protein